MVVADTLEVADTQALRMVAGAADPLAFIKADIMSPAATKP